MTDITGPDERAIPDENGQTPIDIALTMLKAHELGNSQALHPTHAATILSEFDRQRVKLYALTNGLTTFVMSQEDRAKDVLDLDDATLANFARYIVSQTRKVHAKKADQDGADVASTVSLHGIISLALMALNSNAGRLVASAEGITYRGEDKGNWRVIVERVDDLGVTPNALLTLGFASGSCNRPEDGFRVESIDKDEGEMVIVDPTGARIRASFVELTGDEA